MALPTAGAGEATTGAAAGAADAGSAGIAAGAAVGAGEGGAGGAVDGVSAGRDAAAAVLCALREEKMRREDEKKIIKQH